LATDDDERKGVFQAALAQAEELWEAAVTVGPASRPLPLYYSLSQAGRAVCAAWTAGEAWRPEAHGLVRAADDDVVREVGPFGYECRVVTEGHRPGAFPMIAEATVSTTFAGNASVADLWASLPGFPTPHEVFGGRPRCLTLSPAQRPEDARPHFVRLAAPTHGMFLLSPPADLDQLPRDYPTTRGIEQDGVRASLFGGDDPLFRFVGEDGAARKLHEVGLVPYWAEGPFGDLLVRPKVGTESIGPPSEFLTMYALLFCLSELARYYPETWVDALDPDRSQAAVTLEHGLEIATDQAPRLINEALSGPIVELFREQLREREAEAAAATGDEVPAAPANE
jgi:hypothetical protein